MLRRRAGLLGASVQAQCLRRTDGPMNRCPLSVHRPRQHAAYLDTPEKHVLARIWQRRQVTTPRGRGGELPPFQASPSSDADLYGQSRARMGSGREVRSGHASLGLFALLGEWPPLGRSGAQRNKWRSERRQLVGAGSFRSALPASHPRVPRGSAGRAKRPPRRRTQHNRCSFRDLVDCMQR